MVCFGGVLHDATGSVDVAVEAELPEGVTGEVASWEKSVDVMDGGVW